MVRLVAQVLRNPRLPESELARITSTKAREVAIAKSQPQSLAQEQFVKTMYGEHPYGRLFPTDAMLKGYTIAQVKAFHARELRRGASASVRRRSVRAPVPSSVRYAKPSKAGPPAHRHDQPPYAAHPLRPHPARPPGRAAVHDHARPARARSDVEGLDGAPGDRCAARRHLRIAHHDQHPGAEGLHLLAIQLHQHASPAGALGAAGRRHHEIHRRVAQGDFRRNLPPPEGSAVARPRSTGSRTT